MQAAIVDWSNMFRTRLTFCLLLNVSLWAFRKLADSLQSSSYINLRSEQAMYPGLDSITSSLMLSENEGKTNFFAFNMLFRIFLIKWTLSKKR